MSTSADGSDFMQHIQLALGLTASQLARDMGVPLMEVWDRQGTRGQLSDVDRDPFWLQLAEFLDQRVSGAMAAREILQRKLNGDRKRRVTQRLRMEGK